MADDERSLHKMLRVVRAEADMHREDGSFLLFHEALLGEGVTNDPLRSQALRRAAEGSALGFEVRQMSDHLAYGPEFWA